MSIEELHIDFLSKYQRQGYYQLGSFEKDEIDWLLNEAQLVRINQILRGDNGRNGESNFDRVVNKYDVLENLIVLDSPIVTYVKTNTTVEGKLPGNYLEYVGSRSAITCAKTLMQGYISNNKMLIETYPYTKLELYITLLSGSPIKVYNLLDTIEIKNVISDVDAFFYMKRQILDTFNNYGVGLRASFSGDNFLHIECDTKIYNVRMLTMKYHDGSIDGQRTSAAYGKNNTFLYRERATKLVPNKLINHEQHNDIFANPYARPAINNNIIEIAGGVIYSHHEAKVGVTNVNLDYIRMPRMISHRTKQSSELGSSYGAKYHYASQISDIAVKLAVMRNGVPNEGALNIDLITT